MEEPWLPSQITTRWNNEGRRTLSCLFLFFHAKKVSRVIRVTSGPRAARCRCRRCKWWVTQNLCKYYQHVWLNVSQSLPPPRFLSVPPVRSLHPSPPSSCLFSVRSQGAARVGTCSCLLRQDRPRTSRTYYSQWHPGNTCTPAEWHSRNTRWDDSKVIKKHVQPKKSECISFLWNYIFLLFFARVILFAIRQHSIHTICVLAFFFSASPCFLLTTSSNFFSSQFSIVSKNQKQTLFHFTQRGHCTCLKLFFKLTKTVHIEDCSSACMCR